ncbi:MAG: hypothetical protein WC325_02090 [Candidatus Bathyarchaeia archaeon]|jgi:hypothetical protein
MNGYLYQLSFLMVSTGFIWMILGKSRIPTHTRITGNKRWSIKGRESYVLIVLGLITMTIATIIG